MSYFYVLHSGVADEVTESDTNACTHVEAIRSKSLPERK